MKRRFIIYRRKLGGVFYIEDTKTRKQESLSTKDRAEATALLNARNEAARQPQLNLLIAKAYLAGTDSGVSTRTWQHAFDAIIGHKRNATRERWERGARQEAFDLIRERVIIETQAEHLLACMKAGTVSTNVLLRELHNYCLGMNWLSWPIIQRKLWPKFEYKPKRAITADEHRRIIDRELNLESRNFYDLCWHLGGSQTDIANLEAGNIDWSDRVIAYARRKTGSPAFIHFGPAIEAILRSLPNEGLLFPRLAALREKHRAKEFKRRCVGLGIMGVSLHSYRYAWAERAKQCGYGSPHTPDSNYNTLLQYARFSNAESAPATFSWSGMTPGNTYLIQLWVNDGRNIGQSRSETITGGGGTSDPLSFGSDGTGPGQYIVGTFVADNSGSQSLTLTPLSTGTNPDAQINLFQVRDVTPKPNVAWQGPVAISGASDVSTLGTYFGSWAPQDGGANNYPVNGVTFQGFSDLPNFTVGSTLDNGYDGFASPNTSDSNYNTLLQYGRFSNEGTTPAMFSWSGMIPGHTYLVQLWVNDGRNIGQSRSETITGGSSTSAPLSFGSDGTGPGQNITGTFVANSSGGQTLTLTPFSTGPDPDPQINLFQIRDITVLSIPTITGISISGPTLTMTATNGPANGTFVLLQTTDVTLASTQWTPVLTNSFDANGGVTISTNIVNPANPREFYILRTHQ